MQRSQNRANAEGRQAGGGVDAIPTASYDADPMIRRASGQANLTAIALLLGIVITAVWVWKRLSLETQDYIIEQAIPLALIGALCAAIAWMIVKRIRARRHRLRRRAALLSRFSRETSPEKQLETAFALIEVNEYRVKGLESVVPALTE